MMFERFDKGGKIQLNYLIVMIFTLLGFVIAGGVLYMLFSGDFGLYNIVDRTVCEQSVVFRGALLTGTKDYKPLNCKTEKFCITAGRKGSCKELEGSEDVQEIKVKSVREIEQFISRDVLDCWRTMGAGKISLFSNFLAEQFSVSSIYSSCVICSRIAYDRESLEKEGINVDEINLKDYMLTHKVPGKDITYARYLAGEGGKISALSPDNFYVSPVLEEGGELGDGERIEIVEDDGYVSDELAVMFMQVSSPDGWEVFRNTLGVVGGAGAGAAFFTGPKIIKKVASFKVLAVLALAGAYQQYSVSENQAISAGYCSDVSSTPDEARAGCSVVRTVGYDVESISQYCGVIESVG